VKVPSADHPVDSRRPVYVYANGYPRVVTRERGDAYRPVGNQTVTKPVGFIPQVSHTFAYFDSDYGMINEKQLAIAESTTSARTAGWGLHQGGKCLFDIGALTRVALERCESARCAVKVMGELAVDFGFYSDDSGDKADPDYLDAGEALGIVDRYGEVWTFNIITGVGGKSAIWGAQQLDPRTVHVNANDLTIRHMDLSKPDLFLASPDIMAIAEKQGWYDPQRDGPQLDFWNAFAMHSIQQGKRQYVWRRQWRVYSKVAPSQNFSPLDTSFPVGVIPDKKLAVSDIFDLLRDYYKDTPYDLRKGVAAGPFGSPIRYDTASETKYTNGSWERAISIDRGLFSFVAMSRPHLPDVIGASVWFGWDWPSGSVFHPLYVSQSKLPKGYDTIGAQSVFEWGSAWRPFNAINNWSLLRFDVMSKEISRNIAKWETVGFALASKWEAAALALGPDEEAQIKLLTDGANSHAEAIVEAWWELLWSMMAKYANNYILNGEGPAQNKDWIEMGYPDWWLNITEYVAYPKLLTLPLKSGALCEAPNGGGGPGSGGSSEVTLSVAQVWTLVAVVGLLLLLAISCTAMYCRHARLALNGADKAKREDGTEGGTAQESLLHTEGTVRVPQPLAV